MGLVRAQTRLAQRIDVFGGGAEDGHSLLVGEIEERAFIWKERRAVVKEKGAASKQARDQPVPHHPSAGGEVKEPVVRFEVGVEEKLRDVLEQNAAGAMDDAFRHSRRAGGIENEDGVIEGKPR